MTEGSRSARRTGGPGPIQGWAVLGGLLLLIIGAGGLVFPVSGLLTIVHLLTGAAAFFCARSNRLARRFLLGGGGFYLALGFYGTLGIGGAVAEAVPMNTTEVCVSFGLGLVLLVAGLGTPR